MSEPRRQVLQSVVVPSDGAEDWAENWLMRLMPETFPTRAGAKKAVKRGHIAFDGDTAEHHRRVGPGVLLERLEPPGKPAAVFALDLEVVYEDDEMAVVVKLPGFRVNGNLHRTIEHALPHNLTVSQLPTALRRPRPCHRLDAPTGGLLVVAKTARALAHLNRQFEQREIHKTYRAIAIGRLEGSGRIELALDGRDAVTEYEAVDHTHSLRSDWLTTVQLHPVTGRTHQLRRHLQSLGHPILGDMDYGIEGLMLRGKGLFLWATQVELTVPSSGQRRRFVTTEPYKFQSLRAREERRWAKYDALGAGSGS